MRKWAGCMLQIITHSSVLASPVLAEWDATHCRRLSCEPVWLQRQAPRLRETRVRHGPANSRPIHVQGMADFPRLRPSVSRTMPCLMLSWAAFGSRVRLLMRKLLPPPPTHTHSDLPILGGGGIHTDTGNQAIRRILPEAQCGSLGRVTGCTTANTSALVVCNFTGERHGYALLYSTVNRVTDFLVLLFRSALDLSPAPPLFVW